MWFFDALPPVSGASHPRKATWMFPFTINFEGPFPEENSDMRAGVAIHILVVEQIHPYLSVSLDLLFITLLCNSFILPQSWHFGQVGLIQVDSK